MIPVSFWAAERPNVLFIAIDDLNDYISPLDNHPGIQTPNFDKLSNRSVTFSNAHCAAPACHPSRVAVMTGVHPIKSGIYRNMFGAHGPRWRHESPVLEKATVLSQHFRNHGYFASGGGKIFHTLQWTPGDSQNDPEAWDEYRGDPLDPISGDWPRPKLVPDKESGLSSGRPLGGASQLFGAAPIAQSEETYGDHLVVDWAIDQMNQERQKPLFLAVGLFRPHIPWEVSQKWFDLYPENKVRLPEVLSNDLDDVHSHGREGWHKWVVENNQWKHLMRGYLASISYVDYQLGRLLDALDKSPLKDNTIILLWSDHGFHIGEKENWEKFALWDQTTRVPLFIHAPGVSRDGMATHVPVTLTDLYPTLCDLSGIPTPDQCDGASLIDYLSNPHKASDKVALTSFQFYGENKPSHGIADHRFRYIQYGNGDEELYDLKTDPHEFRNLISDSLYNAIREKLSARIPQQIMPIQKIPLDSPYHKKRADRMASIAQKPLDIHLEVSPDNTQPNQDGVLISYGGDLHGYSIYVQNQRLHFALRLKGDRFILSSRKLVPRRKYSVQARLSKDLKMTLSIDFLPVAYGNAPSLILTHPNEGKTIGADLSTPVGDYVSPFEFQGEVNEVKH